MTIEEAIKHFAHYIGNECYTAKHQEACAMAIAALRAQQEQESKPLNGWISVKDRLPETDGIYIVCDRRINGKPWIHESGFRKASSLWCVLHGLYYDGFGRYGEQDKFTHWMPMPEPPVIEKTEE